ncbi:hypothetical protein [Bosea sp. BIWAKO-01]|nr:hypothetical protein [Bosea sp. BIWAKO-01]GAU85922.1 hypothetical protein BIWAKO_05870 [Bosea sp. BIWAKO-01]GAU86652.1 hypothetical protein BIWAKO_06600 [Bosea sp. BIWAKO-01]
MEKPITYVSLNVHKETIAVALAEAGKWIDRNGGVLLGIPCIG